MKTLSGIKTFLLHPARGARGQLALPALMLIPIVLLLIYLLMETTKLSTLKMKHQFALDTATYAEMTYPVVTLNALSIMNGSMPYRVFIQLYQEGLGGEYLDLMTVELNELNPMTDLSKPPTVMAYEFMFKAGAFVGTDSPQTQATADETKNRWQIGFAEGKRSKWLDDSPEPYTPEDEPDYPLNIIANDIEGKEFLKNADYQITYEKVYAWFVWYIMITDIMEGVRDFEDDLQKVRSKAELFRKAYHFNAREGKEKDAGREGSSFLKKYTNMVTTPMYIENEVSYSFTEPQAATDMGSAIGGKTFWGPRLNHIWDISEVTSIDMLSYIETKDKIYQFSYLTPGTKSLLRRLANSVIVTQKFRAPSNYFNINVNKYKPHVRVGVQVMCPDEKNNCVWPNPTPKYQVRLLP